jgi:2-dehydro-3-deoxygluconokinase
MAPTVVCFGELLLRLAAPGHERLLQSPRLDVFVGGAEANVAVGLAGFGHSVAMLTAVADNALGDAAAGELRRAGVDTTRLRRAPGRMGLYFFEQGALQRPSEVLYDRADSAFARVPASAWDWPQMLSGAAHLHLSGITPALGAQSAEAALGAARAARAMGLTVSFDGNYRPKLWQAWGGDAPSILRALMAEADGLFANHRDLGLALGRDFHGDETAAFDAASAAAFAAFPNLRWMAATTRDAGAVQAQSLGARIAERGSASVALAPQRLDGIVDRIGGGDAFAAGVLHGRLKGWALPEVLAFGLAAGAFKHSQPGDALRASEADIRQWMQGGGDVRR